LDAQGAPEHGGRPLRLADRRPPPRSRVGLALPEDDGHRGFFAPSLRIVLAVLVSGATGRASPYPTVLVRTPGTSRAGSFSTASVCLRERRRLSAAEPTASVCPSITTTPSTSVNRSARAAFWRRAVSVSSALPNANSTSEEIGTRSGRRPASPPPTAR